MSSGRDTFVTGNRLFNRGGLSYENQWFLPQNICSLGFVLSGAEQRQGLELIEQVILDRTHEATYALSVAVIPLLQRLPSGTSFNSTSDRKALESCGNITKRKLCTRRAATRVTNRVQVYPGIPRRRYYSNGNADIPIPTVVAGWDGERSQVAFTTFQHRPAKEDHSSFSHRPPRVRIPHIIV